MEAILTQPTYTQYFAEFQKKYKTFNCDASTQIGDIVCINPSNPTILLVNSDNRTSNPSIGIVIKKSSSTRAKIQLFGECSIAITGLQVSRPVFLGTDGKLTQTIPATGFIQKMGIALEDNKIFLNVDYMRIKRTPF
jgi:hypothetical protein